MKSRTASAKWCSALLIGTTPLASANATSAQPGISGVYLCKTLEGAAIASDHFNRSSPKAQVDERAPMGFRMKITAPQGKSNKYQIIELPYDGPDKDLQDGYIFLLNDYVGDGSIFHALRGPGFLTFKGGEGHYQFYQAGLESPGGEDTQLAARWGRCTKEQ